MSEVDALGRQISQSGRGILGWTCPEGRWPKSFKATLKNMSVSGGAGRMKKVTWVAGKSFFPLMFFPPIHRTPLTCGMGTDLMTAGGRSCY